ncbi:MAG: hypothetical protein HYS89_02115 [Candidatus Colwellbacteria bacterium]|nr:hypothetical protein [Candidatus Colwellbacteria bacterium]
MRRFRKKKLQNKVRERSPGRRFFKPKTGNLGRTAASRGGFYTLGRLGVQGRPAS